MNGGAATGTAPLPRSGPAWYFGAVLAWSTTFWLLSTRVGEGPPESSLVFLVGGAGPLLVAIAMTHLRESTATQRDFWVRIVDVGRIGPRWLLAALLVHPTIVVASLLVDRALGGTGGELSLPAGGMAALLSLAFFTFWFGPLPEEIGWRGFALDRLQQRLSPLGASLVLGSVWACWHLPLFVVPGTFQHGIGDDGARAAIFLLGMVPLSVLMTWIYNHTQRSTLSAALVHFSGNLCGALVPKSTRIAAIELALLVLAAFFVTLAGGMARQRGRRGLRPLGD